VYAKKLTIFGIFVALLRVVLHCTFGSLMGALRFASQKA
jgi:hypothetical protein